MTKLEEGGARGREEEGREWHGQDFIPPSVSGIRWPLRTGIGIDTDDGRIPV